MTLRVGAGQTIERTGDVRVALAGELDLATTDLLERAVLPIIATTPARIVLDLSELTFCDSTGTRTILSLSREARRLDTRLVLASPRREVRRIFEIVQLGQLLEID